MQPAPSRGCGLSFGWAITSGWWWCGVMERGRTVATGGAKRVLARLRALRKQKARREEHGACLLMGNEQLLKEVCFGGAVGANAKPLQAPVSLLGHYSRQREIEELGRLTGAQKVYMVHEKELQNVTGLVTVDVKEMVMAELSIPPETKTANSAGESGEEEKRSPMYKTTVVLDGVQDPGNVGSIIRCSLAFGWRHIVFGEGTADPFSSKVLRSSRGGLLMRQAHPGGSRQCLSYEYAERGALREMIATAAERGGMEVLLAHTAGIGLDEYAASQERAASAGTVLVLSSEAGGVSDDMRSSGATALHIPISPVSESLNVAAAAAILLHGLRR